MTYMEVCCNIVFQISVHSSNKHLFNFYFQHLRADNDNDKQLPRGAIAHACTIYISLDAVRMCMRENLLGYSVQTHTFITIRYKIMFKELCL